MRKPIDLFRHAGLVPASTAQQFLSVRMEEWTPEQVRGDEVCKAQKLLVIEIEGSMG